MKKSLIIKIAIVLFICCVAIGIYTVMTREEEFVVTEETFTGGILPRISFEEGGQVVNTLQAYRGDMDMVTMRDTITPLDANGILMCNIAPNQSTILDVSYDVYSIDGSKQLASGTIEEWSPGETFSLNLKEAAISSQECILKMTMMLEKELLEEVELKEEKGEASNKQYAEKVTFYTRIRSYNELYLTENIALVEKLHQAILAKDKTAVDELLEFVTSKAGALQVVNLRSSEDDLLWGTLSPRLVGDVSWNIKESNSNSTAILLTYQVEIADPDNGGALERYNVDEYMRVGYSSKAKGAVVWEYKRTANQVLEEGNIELQSRGVKLGIGEDLTEYAMSDDENFIAFVQQRDLWVYDKEENTMSCLFSFANLMGNEKVSTQHDIRIYEVENNGNVAFAVYGYMDCGSHEGRVGIAIYQYDKVQNGVQEIAFIPSDQSFAIGRKRLENQVYYQGEKDVLYVISGDAFYKVNLVDGIQEVLSEEMSLGKYYIEENGRRIAYQSGTESQPQLSVLEFATGKVVVAKGETGIDMVPLGFLNDDLVYGYSDEKDTKETELGKLIAPMYAVYIQDETGKNMKTYEEEGVFIASVAISSTRIVLNQVTEQGGIYVYTGDDYITNNESEEHENIYVESFTGGAKQVQKRLVFTTDMEETNPEMLHPKHLVNIEAIQINSEKIESEPAYHAYMYGQLALNTTNISEAIQLASDHYGVVTNDAQKYIWMRGNRALNYSLSNSSDFKSQMQSGISALQIIKDASQGDVLIYSGCTTEEMCYIINQGQPVGAKFADGTWNLLVGYSNTTMTYLKPNGSSVTKDMRELDDLIVEMVGSGNA